MTLLQANEKRWNEVKINPSRLDTFQHVAARLTQSSAKARYQAVEKRTGVPWWFIAVVHEREASQNWNANIAQGDPYNRVSVHVPRGRGPFQSWEDAAVDALVNCPPYAARNTDWSPAGALTMLEKYNGLGYAAKGLPSPYIWAGTNQYRSGKYVRDGVYDPNVVDTQLGCAGLLIAMKVFSSTPHEHVAAGTVVTGGVVAASQYPHYAIYIIPAVVIAAIGLFLLIKYFKGKQT